MSSPTSADTRPLDLEAIKEQIEQGYIDTRFVPRLVEEVERLRKERDDWKRSAEARQLEYLNALSPQPEGAQT